MNDHADIEDAHKKIKEADKNLIRLAHEIANHNDLLKKQASASHEQAVYWVERTMKLEDAIRRFLELDDPNAWVILTEALGVKENSCEYPTGDIPCRWNKSPDHEYCYIHRFVPQPSNE